MLLKVYTMSPNTCLLCPRSIQREGDLKLTDFSPSGEKSPGPRHPRPYIVIPVKEPVKKLKGGLYNPGFASERPGSKTEMYHSMGPQNGFFTGSKTGIHSNPERTVPLSLSRPRPRGKKPRATRGRSRPSATGGSPLSFPRSCVGMHIPPPSYP